MHKLYYFPKLYINLQNFSCLLTYLLLLNSQLFIQIFCVSSTTSLLAIFLHAGGSFAIIAIKVLRIITSFLKLFSQIIFSFEVQLTIFCHCLQYHATSFSNSLNSNSISFVFSLSQFFASESLTISAKLSSYFASRWNQFDVIIYLLFIVAFTLRFALHGDEFDWARMVYTITLMLFFVRLLQFFFVHKDIGPKVIIFGGMVRSEIFTHFHGRQDGGARECNFTLWKL